jgi:hypothetical protein
MSTELQWETYERQPRKRSPDWYWAVAIIALSIAVTAIILDNLLFAIFILIATIALFLGSRLQPPLLSIRLTEKGIREGKIAYPWSALESFWVEEEYGAPKLIVKSHTMLSPYLIIPLAETDPESVREFLRQYLPEEEHHEPLSKKIMEFLGF